MILVTGGTGFIGSHLVEHLLSKGEDVRILVRNPSNLRWVEPLRSKIDIVAGDVTNKSTLREAFRDVDEVYHLAAMFRHGVDPGLVWRVNYEGTKNIVDECLRNDVKLLHVSTVGVLGPADSKPLDEKAPLSPNPNPYTRSKAEAEKYVVRKCREEGLRAVIVRPAFVYGPRGTYGLNLLIDMIITGKLRMVIGNGGNYIHPIHVRDLIEALVIVMSKEGKGEIYIAANEKPVKLREFIELVSRFANRRVRFGLPPFIARLILTFRGGIGGSSARETVMLFTRNWFYNVEKLRSIGWRQRVSINEGVEETVRWLSSRELLS